MTDGTLMSGRTYPPIARDRSFWGMLLTQFLGAFNDNFYKQLVMFVCLEVAAVDRASNPQWIATVLFAAPFVLLSGYCGFLSDRFSKQKIVVLSKVLEILVMLMGLLAFRIGSLNAMLAVIALMSAQSALFGPSKYGILPELFDDRDLPQINGFMLMTTFLAIILALPAAGYAKQWAGTELWMTGVIAVGIAVVGTVTSLLVGKTPVARPNLKFSPSSLIIDPETRQLLKRNRPLLLAVIATSIFWTTGGVVYPPGINDLGRLEFGLSEPATGKLAACTGIGITIGCVLAGLMSKHRFNAWLIRVGSMGMFAMLVLIGIPGGSSSTNAIGISGTAIALIGLGLSAGMFSVPLQVYLQAKAPTEFKGRMIGTMNLANWTGICSSAGYYAFLNSRLAAAEIPHHAVFWGAALLIVPLVLFYRPKSESLAEPST